MVKGLGIPSLKQHSVMQTIQTAVANKKNYKHREGALLVIEQLTVSLGRLFEPYVVKLLPHLLNCYGDGNQYVREVGCGHMIVTGSHDHCHMMITCYSILC